MSKRGLRHLLLAASIISMLEMVPVLEAGPRRVDYDRVLAHPALMEEFARMVNVTESHPRDIELAAFLVLDASDQLRIVPWGGPEKERTNTWTGPVPRGTIATVHTHPNGWRRPSHEDHQEAVRTGLPFLVLTRWDIWVAEPDSSRSKVLLRNENWRDERYLAALEGELPERIDVDRSPTRVESAVVSTRNHPAPAMRHPVVSDY